MIPLRPAQKNGRFPILTWALVASNIALLVIPALVPAGADIYARWAFVPARFFASPFSAQGIPTLVGSVFLHAGWVHLAGNMVYLAAFGPIIESRLGWVRYGILYVVSGMIGMLAQGLIAPGSTVAVVGASGAIAGVLGAALIVARGTKITTAVPALVTIEIAELPAGFLVVVWVVLQVASSIGQLEPGVGSTAWYAHLGGILAGVLLATALRRRR